MPYLLSLSGNTYAEAQRFQNGWTSVIYWNGCTQTIVGSGYPTEAHAINAATAAYTELTA